MINPWYAGCCLLLSITCVPLHAGYIFDENGMTLFDEGYSINFGALLQYDILSANSDKTPIKDGNDWRDQQILIRGTIGKNWALKYNYDFKSHHHKDGWIQYRPFALMVGQFKSPVGMENQQIARWQPFTEPSMMTLTAPGRFFGIKWQPVFADRILFAAALQQANFNDKHSMGDSPLRTSARLVYSPVHTLGQLAHLGGSLQFVNYKEGHNKTRIGAVPEVKFGNMPKLTSTGNINAQSRQTGGLEAAFGSGPLSISGEYLYHRVRSDQFKSYGFQGAYAQASYFLDSATYKIYNMAEGAFDKPSKTNLTWELSVRASRLNMEDGDIKGGFQTNYTAGLNFYVNINLKLSLDYIDSHIERGPKGDENPGIIVLRTQISF